MSKTSKCKLVTLKATICGDHLHPIPGSMKETDIEVTDMAAGKGSTVGWSAAYDASWLRMFGTGQTSDQSN